MNMPTLDSTFLIAEREAPSLVVRVRHRINGWGRAAGRLAAFLAFVPAALLDCALSVRQARGAPSRMTRALWLQRWAVRLLRLFNVHVTTQGRPPQTGLLTTNHLGYLDILVLASTQPMIFVAKSEIARWPVLGRLARRAGSLFLERERKLDVARLGAELNAVLGEGVVVALFPEGTSSDGRQVRPFHPALFQPAIDAGVRVSPGWLGYHIEDGEAGEEVCYWRDMTFLPHFLNLLTKREIRAWLRFGEALPELPERKRLAREAHQRVRSLASVPACAL